MELNEYWKRFESEYNGRCAATYAHYYFCDNEKDAAELADLVKKGIKRATASNAWVYEANKEPLPQAGDFNIITDFHQQPQCIVKTTKVEICAFRDVPAEFAFMEGEGDRSLSYWRKCHEAFFSRECKGIGREFHEELPVVLEQFEVVFI
ncbi:MAG: ASCH domain-containing protein [Christensenellales bacterium]